MHQDTLKFYKYHPVKKPQYQGKFCSTPFNALQIDSDGDVQLCDCQLNMPYTIGNIYKNTLQEIWLGQSANQVRQSVIDGDFTYCNWACGSLHTLQTKPKEGSISIPEFPRIIKLDMDRSCNLKCPSCRESVIIEKNSNKIDQQIRLYGEIKKWAQDNPSVLLTLIPVASGEIFASHSGLSFLNSFEAKNLGRIKNSLFY
jgi:MoaA/NifB/PqqE/SkfB family radical SAM enzyme